MKNDERSESVISESVRMERLRSDFVAEIRLWYHGDGLSLKTIKRLVKDKWLIRLDSETLEKIVNYEIRDEVAALPDEDKLRRRRIARVRRERRQAAKERGDRVKSRQCRNPWISRDSVLEIRTMARNGELGDRWGEDGEWNREVLDQLSVRYGISTHSIIDILEGNSFVRADYVPKYE